MSCCCHPRLRLLAKFKLENLGQCAWHKHAMSSTERMLAHWLRSNGTRCGQSAWHKISMAVGLSTLPANISVCRSGHLPLLKCVRAEASETQLFPRSRRCRGHGAFAKAAQPSFRNQVRCRSSCFSPGHLPCTGSSILPKK